MPNLLASLCLATAAMASFAALGADIDPTRAAADAAVAEAVRKGDYTGAIALDKAWIEKHPTDLDFIRTLPWLYSLAGDRQGWQQARSDMVARWAAMKGRAARPAAAGFLIESFKVGSNTVRVQQCYEPAGKFGVSYVFNVFGERGRTSFFTIESPVFDNEVAKEQGRPTPVVTVDRFVPGRHETVAIYEGLQDYAVLRQRVIDYMNRPAPLSFSTTLDPGLSTESCEFAN